MKIVECEEELLIACALKKELKALRERLRLKCHFIVTGVGFQKTVASLENYFQRERRPSFFVFTGTAGQLDPSLEIGEIVFPEEWCIQGGPCFSADEKLLFSELPKRARITCLLEVSTGSFRSPSC